MIVAQAWLQGHGYIDAPPWMEHVLINGHVYAIRPILGGIVCLPFAWIGLLRQTTVASAAGATAVSLAYQLTESLWLTGLLGFGTLLGYESMFAGVWGMDIVLACTCGMAALLALKQRRSFLTGVFAGLEFLARYDTAFTIGAYIWLAHLRKLRLPSLLAGWLICFGVYILANELRWHLWYDPTLARIHDANGTIGPLFSLHYLPNNLFVALFAGPQPLDHFPWFHPSLNGQALLLTSPALIGVLRPSWRHREVQASWLGVCLTAGPFLCWYWTGYAQIGARYWIQVLPWAMKLLSLNEMDQFAQILIVASVIITQATIYSGVFLP